MWCWIRNGLLERMGRQAQPSVSKEERERLESNDRTGSTAVGWRRLLGTVAASRGNRRTIL